MMRRKASPESSVSETKTRPFGPLGRSHLAEIVKRNISVIDEHQKHADESRGTHERVADAITGISGSISFVFAHVVWFAVWILANVGYFGLTPFDPYPFGLLTTIVSLEAIFLSTFVLVSQNRLANISDRRAQLDLQINLLAEYELTRLLRLQNAIVEHLNIKIEEDSGEFQQLLKHVDPEAVLQTLENGK